MKLPIALLLCALAMGIPACQESTGPKLVVGKGTILPSQAECSSWFLQADSGALYELTQLDAEFQHVDLRVRFALKERNDVATVCMRGPVADVVSMTRL